MRTVLFYDKGQSPQPVKIIWNIIIALAQEEFQEIESFLYENLPKILADQSLAKPPVVYEIELRERMIRVEEELKNQRELMKEQFVLSEKRFEQWTSVSSRCRHTWKSVLKTSIRDSE